MSCPSVVAVLAERYANSWVGDALSEHRQDRERLLASLVTSLQNDPSIYATWFGGSFGRGEADDLSDLDPWLVVADEALPQMAEALRRSLEQTGTFLMGSEVPQNAPPSGGFFTGLLEGRKGLLQVDCSWQSLSATRETAVQRIPSNALLFNHLGEQRQGRSGLPVSPRSGQTSPVCAVAIVTDELEALANRLGYAWMMLSITTKTLARYPHSDLGLMFYLKPAFEEVAARLGRHEIAATTDWSVPEHPKDKVERLRHLCDRTGNLTQTAMDRGVPISSRIPSCMAAYLDMVSGIVHARVETGHY